MEEYRQLVLLPLIRYSHGNFKVTRRIIKQVNVIVSVSVKERMSFGIVENKIQTKAFILLVGQNFCPTREYTVTVTVEDNYGQVA